MKARKPIFQFRNLFVIVLFTVNSFFTVLLHAQICGTTSHTVHRPSLEKANTEYTVKLVVWLVGDDNGNGALEYNKVFDMFSHSFPLFEEHGIYFEVCSSKIINNTTYLNNPDQLIFDVSNPNYFLDGFINYYLINSDASSYNGGAAGRKGTSTRAWGYFDEALPSFIFSHELGHILSLNHTFSDLDCYADCDNKGDEVCDTPPDPYKPQADQTPSVVGYRYSAPCDFVNISNLRTSCGELYTDIGYEVPFGQNMMSYYLGYDCPDLKKFTSGQGQRMREHISQNPEIILVEDDPDLFKECISKRSIVWEDFNGNGIQDQFESGIPNVKVQLLEVSNINNIIAEELTDQDGFYEFKNINSGNYFLQFISPTNKIPSFSNFGLDELDSDIDASGSTGQINYQSGNDLNYDAGFITPSRIGNKVWIDNPNGIMDILDPSDSPFPGVVVMLFNGVTGELLEEEVTDDNGNYIFQMLPGQYKIGIQAPTNYRAVKMNAGSESVDSDIDPVSNRSEVIYIDVDKTNLNIDAGFSFDVSLAIASFGFSIYYNEADAYVELNWQNQNVKDIERFEVERRIYDVGNFVKVCELEANQTQDIYACIDVDLSLSGLYQYRLKEIYFDGKEEYSAIKQIKISSNFSFKLFPNPLYENTIYLDIDGINREDLTISIYDRKGQCLLEEIELEDNSASIDLSTINAGLYFVRINAAGQIYHSKFLKF